MTSYVFRDGRIDYERLEELVAAVGKERLVLDLSCRWREEAGTPAGYYIVTDRWQKFTDEKVTLSLLNRLKDRCDEFLIHAVDVEGKAYGIEMELVLMLGEWGEIPVTYAGGVGSFADLEQLKVLGQDRVNVTIGSALDLFGGTMEYAKVLDFMLQVQ